jgi:hypothetical protein
MNNEISEEYKRALADLPRRKALARLEQDGAQSTAAVQRRVRTLAQERNILPADFAKLMHKRILILREAQSKLRLAPLRRPAGLAHDDPGGESHAV